MEMKPFAAIALLALAFLFLGCVRQETKFACPDGTTVSNKSQCAPFSPQKPAPTASPAVAAIAITSTPIPTATAPPIASATPLATPTATPAQADGEKLKCFSSSDCYFSGSICASRLAPQETDGKSPCQNCVCTCTGQKCAQSLHFTPTPSPTPTPVPEQIGISNVEVKNIQLRSVEVQWRTLRETTSHISFGFSPSTFSLFYDDATINVTEHWVPLGQLTHNKTYYFEVKSCVLDANGTEGKCDASGGHNFTTKTTP